MWMLRLGLLGSFLFTAAPAQSQPAAPLNSGGGTRTGSGIQVVDGAGLTVAGTAAGDGVKVSSGFVTSHPTITPIALRTFHLTVEDAGVVLTWEGDEERRSFGFRVLRSRQPLGTTQVPEDEFEQIDHPFPGHGPHRFVDESVAAGFIYFYRLKWYLGSGETLDLGPWSIEITETPGVKQAVVYPAQPNPFHKGVAISFDLPQPSKVGWRLHDVRGRRVAGGSLGLLPAGHHAHTIETLRPISQGVYFIRVFIQDKSFVQKVVRLP